MATEESPIRDRGPIGTAAAIEQLQDGEVTILGRMPWSSNATFLVDVTPAETGEHRELVQGIYKPERGERPLWDFPGALYKREIAAFVLSEHLAWDLVPPTVLRHSELGPGSLQLFVPHDFEAHYFTYNDDPTHRIKLQQLCVFDVLANSTDRKGGHCLLTDEGHIFAIDNGLTFHEEFKLRTVIWDWAGEELPTALRDELVEFLDSELPAELAELLEPAERDAIGRRGRSLLAAGTFPIDPTGRRIPWPVV